MSLLQKGITSGFLNAVKIAFAASETRCCPGWDIGPSGMGGLLAMIWRLLGAKWVPLARPGLEGPGAQGLSLLVGREGVVSSAELRSFAASASAKALAAKP